MLYNLVMLFGLSLISIFSNLPNLFKPLVILGLASIFLPGVLAPDVTHNNASLFALSNASSQAVLYTVIVLSIPNRLFRFFPMLCLINSLWMIFSPKHYGLGMATSMDSVLIAIMYPMYLQSIGRFSMTRESWLSLCFKFSLVIIPILAIFISGGSVGIGGLTLGLIVLYSRPKFYRYLLVPIALFILYAIMDPHLFDDSLRFVAWRWTMDWWTALPIKNVLFGTGIGTFSILGPYIQLTTNHMPNVLYTELHNDWLQILFEFGSVGLLSALSLFSYLIYRARYDRYLLSSIVVFGATAIFYYPLHNVVTAAYGVLLFKVILDLDNYSSDNFSIRP